MKLDSDQNRTWQSLYRDVVQRLAQFGTDDYLGRADYLVVDDNLGSRRVTVEIHRLHMLRPEIVAQLRDAIGRLPEWEIVVAVDIPDKEGRWPPMGLTIRPHEIIDGLRREFLPLEWRNVSYPDSKPGTGYD